MTSAELPNEPSKRPVPDADDLDWQGYEKLVRDILEALGQTADVEIVCWGPSCVVEGPSGVRHQVDVLTRHSDGMNEYRTAVSCRWRNRKVEISHVRELASIVQDAALSKGVIVSKSGFTKGAKGLAAARGIGLIELRKPTDEDWGDGITDVRAELIIDRGPALFDVCFRRAVPIPESNDESAEKTPMPRLLKVSIPGGDDKALVELAEDAHRDNPEQEYFELDFPHGTVLITPEDPGHPVNGRGVRGVSFRLQALPPHRFEVSASAKDLIFMIMRDALTNLQHNITTDGEIIETAERATIDG